MTTTRNEESAGGNRRSTSEPSTKETNMNTIQPQPRPSFDITDGELYFWAGRNDAIYFDTPGEAREAAAKLLEAAAAFDAQRYAADGCDSHWIEEPAAFATPLGQQVWIFEQTGGAWRSRFMTRKVGDEDEEFHAGFTWGDSGFFHKVLGRFEVVAQIGPSHGYFDTLFAEVK